MEQLVFLLKLFLHDQQLRLEPSVLVCRPVLALLGSNRIVIEMLLQKEISLGGNQLLPSSQCRISGCLLVASILAIQIEGYKVRVLNWFKSAHIFR